MSKALFSGNVVNLIGDVYPSGTLSVDPETKAIAIHDGTTVGGTMLSIKGKDGTNGIDGKNGTNGTNGKDGVDGKNGVNGTNGKDGLQGLKGDKGDTGAPGAMNQKQYIPSSTVSVNGVGQTILSTTFTSTGNPVFLIVTGDANPINGGSWCRVQWFRNGVAIGKPTHLESGQGNVNITYCAQTVDTPTAGTYTYSLQTTLMGPNSFQFGESDPPVANFIELTGATGPAGKDGASITSATINSTGNLIITKSDGTTVDAGKVSATATTATTTSTAPMVGSAPNPFAPIIVSAPQGYKAANLDDGVELTLDTLAVQLPASGTRSLQMRVTSGTMSVQIAGECFWCPGNYAGTYDARYWTGNTLTTSYQQLFTWNFPWAGDKSVYNVQDLTNRRLYRVTLIIGSGYKKNFIVMERLV